MKFHLIGEILSWWSVLLTSVLDQNAETDRLWNVFCNGNPMFLPVRYLCSCIIVEGKKICSSLLVGKHVFLDEVLVLFNIYFDYSNVEG